MSPAHRSPFKLDLDIVMVVAVQLRLECPDKTGGSVLSGFYTHIRSGGNHANSDL